MERLTPPDKISADERIFYNGLMDSVLGNPQIMDTAPSTANGLLKENNFGFKSGVLYITISSVTYSITLTPTAT